MTRSFKKKVCTVDFSKFPPGHRWNKYTWHNCDDFWPDGTPCTNPSQNTRSNNDPWPRNEGGIRGRTFSGEFRCEHHHKDPIDKKYIKLTGMRYSKYRITTFLETNIPKLRYIQNGSEDEELIDKLSIGMKPLENLDSIWDPVPNRFDLHHPAVISGVSVDKTFTPSMIIRNINILDLSTDKLEELLLLFAVSTDTHIIFGTMFRNAALSYENIYPRERWNWVLQSEENFNKFKEKYNRPDLDYERTLKKGEISHFMDGTLELPKNVKNPKLTSESFSNKFF